LAITEGVHTLAMPLAWARKVKVMRECARQASTNRTHHGAKQETLPCHTGESEDQGMPTCAPFFESPSYRPALTLTTPPPKVVRTLELPTSFVAPKAFVGRELKASDIAG